MQCVNETNGRRSKGSGGLRCEKSYCCEGAAAVKGALLDDADWSKPSFMQGRKQEPLANRSASH